MEPDLISHGAYPEGDAEQSLDSLEAHRIALRRLFEQRSQRVDWEIPKSSRHKAGMVDLRRAPIVVQTYGCAMFHLGAWTTSTTTRREVHPTRSSADSSKQQAAGRCT